MCVPARSAFVACSPRAHLRRSSPSKLSGFSRIRVILVGFAVDSGALWAMSLWGAVEGWRGVNLGCVWPVADEIFCLG